MSQAAAGAGQGLLQGATAGAAVGGLPGAIIGGIVGGVWGAFAGSYGDKAKKKMKQAAQIQQLREQESYRQQYLLQIRQARIQRASSLALSVAMGTEESSGSQGALSSIGSQTANNVEYMSVDRQRELYATYLYGKAQKLSNKGANIQQGLSITSSIVGLAGAAYSMAGAKAAEQAATQASNSAFGQATVQQGTIGGFAAEQASGTFLANAETWKQTAANLRMRAMFGIGGLGQGLGTLMGSSLGSKK